MFAHDTPASTEQCKGGISVNGRLLTVSEPRATVCSTDPREARRVWATFPIELPRTWWQYVFYAEVGEHSL